MNEERIAQGLEIGIGVMGIVTMVGAVALLLGRLIGEMARSGRLGEVRPESGSVPAERHHHVITSSPR